MLGGETMTIKVEDVERVFREAQSASDYVVGLYKLVVPDWDDVEKLEGYVQVSQEMADKIMRLAMRWDRDHGVGFPGGLWLNYGFSVDPDLKGGEVIVPPAKRYITVKG